MFFALFRFFDPKSYGILAPQPGMEPATHALESEILTTGPSRMSHMFGFKIRISESKNCYQWKQKKQLCEENDKIQQ